MPGDAFGELKCAHKDPAPESKFLSEWGSSGVAVSADKCADAVKSMVASNAMPPCSRSCTVLNACSMARTIQVS